MIAQFEWALTLKAVSYFSKCAFSVIKWHTFVWHKNLLSLNPKISVCFSLLPKVIFITASNPRSASFRRLDNPLSSCLTVKLVLGKLGKCQHALSLRFFCNLQRNLIKERAQAEDFKNLSDNIQLVKWSTITSFHLDKAVMAHRLCTEFQRKVASTFAKPWDIYLPCLPVRNISI